MGAKFGDRVRKKGGENFWFLVRKKEELCKKNLKEKKNTEKSLIHVKTKNNKVFF